MALWLFSRELETDLDRIKQIEVKTKWLPFCRRHFQIAFFTKNVVFWCKFHWSLFQTDKLTIIGRLSSDNGSVPFDIGIKIGLVDGMLSLCYHTLSDPVIIYYQQHPRKHIKIHDKCFGRNDVFEYLWRFDSIDICYIIIRTRCRHSEENWLHNHSRLTHWTPWRWRCLKNETAITFHPKFLHIYDSYF